MARPFLCDAEAPHLTGMKALVATVVMVHNDQWMYSSIGSIANSRQNTRPVPPLPSDPYEAEDFDMEDMHII